MSEFRLRVRDDAPAILTTVAEVEALRADNARLRALIMSVENGTDNGCPWCGAWPDDSHSGRRNSGVDCPAFMGRERGVLR